MKLLHAMLIGGVMTTVSGAIGLLTLPLFASAVEGASTRSGAGDGAALWSAPEPEIQAVVAIPDETARHGVDPLSVLVLAGLLHR